MNEYAVNAIFDRVPEEVLWFIAGLNSDKVWTPWMKLKLAVFIYVGEYPLVSRRKIRDDFCLTQEEFVQLHRETRFFISQKVGDAFKTGDADDSWYKLSFSGEEWWMAMMKLAFGSAYTYRDYLRQQIPHRMMDVADIELLNK